MELNKGKWPSKSSILAHVKLYFETNQQKKELEKILKSERVHFEEYTMIECNGELQIGNYEVKLSPSERTSFDLDYAEKALSSEDFVKYIKPYLKKTLSAKLNVKKI